MKIKEFLDLFKGCSPDNEVAIHFLNAKGQDRVIISEVDFAGKAVRSNYLDFRPMVPSKEQMN